MKILIVGAGLSGSVIARDMAEGGNEVLVIEKRDHIAGNCYDYIDDKTGILMNKYGAHLFHTNSEQVWEYINRFSEWIRWDHEVVSYVENKLVPIPVNITTVNQLCGTSITNTEEMDKWLKSVQYSGEIRNSEDIAISRVGKEIYEKLFKPYTIKQWNKDPTELDPSVLARIPVRNSFDTRYFSDKYQVLPKYGYTKFVESILNHKNIKIQLNTDFFEINSSNYDHVIFTGPIDKYFESSGLPKLEYRSINFEINRLSNYGYFQPKPVVNYPETNVDFTRIVEYKHFYNQTSDSTVIVKEFTTDKGEPYYPVPNKQNLDLYEKYRILANKESNVHFVGRLASYKYFNMDDAILNALNFKI
uniref:UDP-galactopyranose mutase C-terminal domain-containing protein n=1 Tax=viral metagenome TaxID=1070528 RepID=A0A6C0JRV4_9ZZZZ